MVEAHNGDVLGYVVAGRMHSGAPYTLGEQVGSLKEVEDVIRDQQIVENVAKFPDATLYIVEVRIVREVT